jgi:ABC-type branched-subunit amino acid transport system substrate-binding protein
MAPEQLAGRPADARSDVYAFAVSLWESLHGDRPFTGKSLRALQRAKATEDLTYVAPTSEVPEALREILRRGLRADPDARFPTMTALLDALTTAIDPSRKKGRKSNWIAIGVGVIAVAASLAIVAQRGRGRSAAPVAISASSASPIASSCSPKKCAADHGGEPWTCRPSDHACVAIASEDCHVSMERGDAEHDDTVWLGAMFPLTGPKADDYGKMNAEGAEFARREFATATRGLQSAGSVRHVPRIALVVCDDEAMPARAAKHLVEQVGVPAILGFGTGQTLVELAASELVPHEVVAMASLTSSPLATRVPQPSTLPRLVWRTSYDANEFADAAAIFVSEFFAKRPGATSPTRVVVARDARQMSVSIADELSRSLVLDGTSVLQATDRFRELGLPDDPPNDRDVEALARRFVEVRPTVIVFYAAWSPSALFARIEGAWPREAPRPTYLALSASTDQLADFIGPSADRRHRVFSVTTPTREPAALRFIARYNADRADRVTPFFNPSSTYDAFYALAYAIAAVGDGPIRGPSIASALTERHAEARAVEVGPLGVFDAISALNAGMGLDLVGASGTLAFGASTGSTLVDFSLVCTEVAAAPDAGATLVDRESGLVVRSRTHTLDGRFDCP